MCEATEDAGESGEVCLFSFPGGSTYTPNTMCNYFPFLYTALSVLVEIYIIVMLKVALFNFSIRSVYQVATSHCPSFDCP